MNTRANCRFVPVQESVYQFSDFRAFLKNHAQEAKKRNPSWSYGAWARRLGLSGTAALTMVIHGQRNPGQRFMEKLNRYFEFDAREREYFSNLVRLQKYSTDPEMRVLLMEKIASIHPTGSFRLLDVHTFDAISHWYFYAIREMTLLDRFQEDPAWISSELRFKVSPRDATYALRILKKLGLLRRDSQGRLKPSDGTIDTTSDIAAEGIKRFHEEMIEHAKTSVRSADVSERELNATTLALHHRDLAKAKQLIRKFQDQFCRTLEKGSGDSVYQLGIQFFPLTKAAAK